MPDFTIYIVPEADVTLSGGVVLDGVTQGDGSHLANSNSPLSPPVTISIDYSNFQEVEVNETGSTDTTFDDNDSTQAIVNPITLGIDGNGTVRTYAAGTRIEAEYEFIAEDPATGEQYRILAVNLVGDPGNSFGSIEGLAFVGDPPPEGVTLTIIRAVEGPPNPGAAVPYVETAVLCFLNGTLIETAHGPKPVEGLMPGDAVLTVAGDTRILRRNYASRFDLSKQGMETKLYPVRITKGALGHGLPKRDLLVSRQHRMLLRSLVAKRMFGTTEALVSAIRLTGLPGIYVETALAEVSYHHLLFDRHEIILAEGAPSESLYLGTEARAALPLEVQQEIALIFPNIPVEPAALIPKLKHQNKLVDRHIKNKKPLLMR